MDRLLCGDVGFGKTEVALRAAFKCVLDAKQCAVLVPTTILAWQHYQTFRNRMEGLPGQGGDALPLSHPARSRSRSLRGAAAAARSTSSSAPTVWYKRTCKFKDLGLCIIDEEQRFGVKHKETV